MPRVSSFGSSNTPRGVIEIASIAKDASGNRTIQFVGKDRKRRSVRLGKCSQRQAEAVKVQLERLVHAGITGHPVDPDLARWLTEVDGKLADKLVAVGLIPKREAATLDAFLSPHIAKMEVKDVTQTKIFYGYTQRNLVEFFGPEKRLADITLSDAGDFESYLKQQGLSEATITRRCRLAKTFFNAAVRHQLVSESPFCDVKCKVHDNEARQRFSSCKQAQKTIDTCLMRNGGCWSHWLDMAVFASRAKSSHSVESTLIGSEIESTSRVRRQNITRARTSAIPMFPELKPYLDEAWEQATEGPELVISKHRSTAGKSETGWNVVNLRTQFEKIQRRAGLNQ